MLSEPKESAVLVMLAGGIRYGPDGSIRTVEVLKFDGSSFTTLAQSGIDNLPRDSKGTTLEEIDGMVAASFEWYNDLKKLFRNIHPYYI